MSEYADCEENIDGVFSFLRDFVTELVENTCAKDVATELDSLCGGEQKPDPNGYKYVEDMMKKWQEAPELHDWCFYIRYINKICDCMMDYRIFQVKWTKPMEGYTYPTIVVDVYVFVKLNLGNTDSPADIKYVFEGNQFVRNSRMHFNPNWLYNAYENKESVVKPLTF